jgi:diguanylate cyclase (GGDEF)-like protein/PAS domain S-box-containing protein
MPKANDRSAGLVAELEELRVQNVRFETVLESLLQGVCLFDGDQRLILCNRRYLELYGVSAEQVRPGVSLREVTEARIAAGSFPKLDTETYHRWRETVINNDKPHDSVVELGNGRIMAIHHHPMSDGGWVATHEDITESRRAEERIAHLVSHDALTGLPNRLMFHTRLKEVSAACSPTSALTALLYLDLDHFTTVNDTFGHAAGDHLLQTVSDRLRGLCRRTDTVARLGADRFAVIVDGIVGPHGAEALAARIIAAIGRPCPMAGHELRVTASVGIALCRQGTVPDPERLMRAADAALRRAKAEGGGKYCVFRPDMIGAAGARQQLNHDLRRALEAGEFELHYQPQVDLETEQVIGAEALIRWRHPTRGLVPPNEFIPFAEESGLIIAIDQWVLRTACREAVPWGDLRLAVNMSPAQLRMPGLVGLVSTVLQETGLEPERLEIEITERVLIGNSEASAAALHALAALGVRLAVDDFGTGYASFDYLRRYPFKKLKIDRSFIRDLGRDANSFAIIQAIVGMCRRMGLWVNAEGVEAAVQAALLRAEGCREAQGYLYGRAMPAADFARMVGCACPDSYPPVAA